MRSRKIIVALCTAAACAALLAQAQQNLYRWVDKDGKVHFTDTPPPQDAKSSTQKRFGGGQVDASQLPYATQMAARRFPVTLYATPDCGDLCNQGRDLLSRRGVPFTEKNPLTNNADADALKKAIGALEVPVLMVGDNPLKGYAAESWQAALDTAGCARTRLPGQAAPAKSQ